MEAPLLIKTKEDRQAINATEINTIHLTSNFGSTPIVDRNYFRIPTLTRPFDVDHSVKHVFPHLPPLRGVVDAVSSRQSGRRRRGCRRRRCRRRRRRFRRDGILFAQTEAVSSGVRRRFAGFLDACLRRRPIPTLANARSTVRCRARAVTSRFDDDRIVDRVASGGGVGSNRGGDFGVFSLRLVVETVDDGNAGPRRLAMMMVVMAVMVATCLPFAALYRRC